MHVRVMYYTIERVRVADSSHHTNATITVRARDHLAGHGRLIDFRKKEKKKNATNKTK